MEAMLTLQYLTFNNISCSEILFILLYSRLLFSKKLNSLFAEEYNTINKMLAD